MTVDVYASKLSYLHHLLPIWKHMTEDGTAGRFHATRPLWPHLQSVGVQPHQGTPEAALVLVASPNDMTYTRQTSRIILAAHGVGQCYGGVPNSLISVKRPHLNRIVAAVGPNDQWTTAVRSLGVAAFTVGVPKMDGVDLSRPVPADLEPGRRLRVGMFWHWDQGLFPETRSAFGEYVRAFGGLVERFDVVGSSHPKDVGSKRLTAYKKAGIPFQADPETVMEWADVVTFDNTSAGFEAAARGIPVVVVNADRYRRTVGHGLRFWDWADIGPQCDDPLDLGDKIVEAWERAGDYTPVRDRMREAIFPNWGNAAASAAAAIRTTIEATT